jgi:hypothetical protein
MPELFPPGELPWSKTRQYSRWREFAYVFHEMKRVIVPVVHLPEIMDNWSTISRDLAEAPRARRLQVGEFFRHKTS